MLRAICCAAGMAFPLLQPCTGCTQSERA